MPETEHLDVVILGSGQGGKLLAWHLGRSGKRLLSSNAAGWAALVLRSPACRPRMNSGAPGLLTWSGTPLISVR